MTDSRSDTDIVEEAETCRVIGLSMMAWRSDDGDGVSDVASYYRSTRFNRSTARQRCAVERQFMEVHGIMLADDVGIGELFFRPVFLS